jgi:hypothetical protein
MEQYLADLIKDMKEVRVNMEKEITWEKEWKKLVSFQITEKEFAWLKKYSKIVTENLGSKISTDNETF